MKRLLYLTVALVVGIASAAFAANYGDTFQITFTPTGDRGVYIDSDTVPLGDLALGAGYDTNAIPTHSTGTVANIEYSISATESGSATNLTANGTATPTADEIQVQAVFDADGGTFGWAANDNVDGTVRPVDDGVNFVTGDVSMEDLGLNQLRKLYCRVTLPSVVNYSGVQTITVTLTARQGD